MLKPLKCTNDDSPCMHLRSKFTSAVYACSLDINVSCVVRANEDYVHLDCASMPAKLIQIYIESLLLTVLYAWVWH